MQKGCNYNLLQGQSTDLSSFLGQHEWLHGIKGQEDAANSGGENHSEDHPCN